MALTVENGHEATQECPVCFENVLAAKRSLSCRHVFCQDCLSKITLVAKSQGSIVCPLCRQATYLNKQNQAGETLAADVSPTEEAPLPLPMGYLVMALRASIVALLRGGNLMMHHLRRLSQQSSEQTVANRNGSQVFIISDQVRPTTRNDTAVGIPEPESSECLITQCSVFCLVVVFCLIALLWVLVSCLSACLDFIQSQDRHVASHCDNNKNVSISPEDRCFRLTGDGEKDVWQTCFSGAATDKPANKH